MFVHGPPLQFNHSNGPPLIRCHTLAFSVESTVAYSHIGQQWSIVDRLTPMVTPFSSLRPVAVVAHTTAAVAIVTGAVVDRSMRSVVIVVGAVDVAVDVAAVVADRVDIQWQMMSVVGSWNFGASHPDQRFCARI